MFDIFKHTIETLTSSTEKWTTKTATVALIFFGLWFLNNTFDFTQSFRINNRLQQLEQIGQLIKDTTLTKEQIDILKTERVLVFERKTTLDKAYSLLDSLPNSNFIKRKTVSNPKMREEASKNSVTKEESKSIDLVKKNYWLHYLFSNMFLIIVILAVPFSISWTKGFKVIVGLIFILGSLFLFGMLVAYLLDLIPVIANRPWINYSIDFVAQLLFWMFIGLLAQKDKKNQSGKPTFRPLSHPTL